MSFLEVATPVSLLHVGLPSLGRTVAFSVLGLVGGLRGLRIV